MKKSIIIFILSLVLLISFSGCLSKPAPVYATVKITALNQQVILEESCRLPSDSTAADAIGVACRSAKIAYQDKNGLYDNFNGISSGKEEGWLFYYNGTLSEYGVRQTKLTNDGENLVEMRYVNFNEAFFE